MKAFRFLSKNWYYAGGVLFVALAFLVGFFGDALDPLRNILLLSFMALLVHQFEEYAIPGGFPAVFNIGLMGEKEFPDRRPLNRKSALIVNVIEGYPFYLLAVIFPGGDLVGACPDPFRHGSVSDTWHRDQPKTEDFL